MVSFFCILSVGLLYLAFLVYTLSYQLFDQFIFDQLEDLISKKMGVLLIFCILMILPSFVNTILQHALTKNLNEPKLKVEERNIDRTDPLKIYIIILLLVFFLLLLLTIIFFA